MAPSSCHYVSRKPVRVIVYNSEELVQRLAYGVRAAVFHDVRCDPRQVGRPAMKHTASLTERQGFRLFPSTQAAVMAAFPQLSQGLLRSCHGCKLKPEPVSASTQTVMQYTMRKRRPPRKNYPQPVVSRPL